MGGLRVATWNLNCFTPSRREQKRKLLELEAWDVALLQEVDPTTFELLVDHEEFSGVSAIDQAGRWWGGRSHGAAILVRDSVTIRSCDVLPVEGIDASSSDKWDVALRCRALWARASTPLGDMTFASAHMSNAAGDGEVRVARTANKMRHYRSLSSLVSSAPRPLVIGMDVNSWPDQVDPWPVDPTDPFVDEHRFVVPRADHGLRDALVEHLVNNKPEILARGRSLGAEGLDGALDVTYQRSGSNRPQVNRMDRIYVSDEFTVTDVRSLYADALTVGSDHALVIATLHS